MSANDHQCKSRTSLLERFVTLINGFSFSFCGGLFYKNQTKTFLLKNTLRVQMNCATCNKFHVCPVTKHCKALQHAHRQVAQSFQKASAFCILHRAPIFSVIRAKEHFFTATRMKKEWMKRHQWNCTKNMGSNSTLTFRYFASSWFHLVRYEPKVYFACRKIKKCR